MKRENLQLLISLIKLKKLHISELEKSMAKLKTNKQVVGIYASMTQIMKIDEKILDDIVKSEEKE